jgi:hypothetical protein
MNRVGAFSGAAYVLLVNVGSSLAGQASETEGSPGQQILDEQSRIADNPLAPVGMGLILVGFVAWMMFVGYLYSRLRRGGWLATTALIGGTVTVAVNLASASSILVLYLLRDDISPETARVLMDLDGAGFILQLVPAGVFAFFAAAAALVTRVLGRILSWAGMVIGATSILVNAATALNLSEEFFPWPFLLVLLWVAVVSLRLGFARTRTALPSAVDAPPGMRS